MVLKTTGLEYDDRVRKESQSLSRAGCDVRISLLDGSNEAGLRTVWDSVTASSFSLLTRRLFAQGRVLAPKLAEFNLKAVRDLLRARPDVVWAHNQESAPAVALALLLRRAGLIDGVVWDQHELPRPRILESRLLRRLWGRLMRACDAVVVANEERRDYLRQRLPAAEEIQFSVLENWADSQFRNLPVAPLPGPLGSWLHGRSYLLLQGGAHPGRHFREVVEAVMEHADPELGLVVVGGRSETTVASLREQWGEAFDDRVFFTGWVPQFEIPPYIDHALASLVLYDLATPNSLLCAPNRLFQAVARATPVIVGANPPMARLVSRLGLGIVLDGAGGDPVDIARGIERLRAHASTYRRAAESSRDSLLWEEQDTVISAIVRS